MLKSHKLSLQLMVRLPVLSSVPEEIAKTLKAMIRQ